MPLEGATSFYSDVGSKGDMWWICVVRFAYGNRLPNVIFFWLSLIASRHESVQRHETINWGNNPDYGKSKDSYIVMLADDRINLKLGLKGPISQSTMEAELVVAALSLCRRQCSAST